MKITDEHYRELCDAGGKDLRKNIAIRMAMLKEAKGDKSYQNDLWICCSRDPLFYINMFLWGYNPRNVAAPRVPFLTYPFQDETIYEIIQSFGKEDRCIVKSRDMGASFMGLFSMEWAWHFYPDLSFSMMSYKQELVDKRGDPKSLFWKIDTQHEMQPAWLIPEIDRKLLHIGNEDNGSTIEGEFTTGNAARGDRKTAILLDEFGMVEEGHKVLASTADATHCRIFNSTPLGSTNAFYTVFQNPNIKNIPLHWPMHPEKAVGLYYDAEGKPRSPWYDKECLRRSNPKEIAQELDLDFSASDYQYFDAALVARLTETTVRKPEAEGDISYDVHSLQPSGISIVAGGPLKLWCKLDAEGKPSRVARYVIGCDIAMGTRDASSNSVASIGDADTGEKVAEYATNYMSPYEFADAVCALGRFFAGKEGSADLIFEVNGPGRMFKDRVVERVYRPLYYRKMEDGLNPKLTDKIGFFTTTDTKRSLFGVYRDSLTSGAFRNRSYDAVQEMGEYIYRGGAITHSGAERSLDPSASSDNHGDRVIADALCAMRMKEITEPVYTDEVKEETPVGSFAWRRERRQQARRERDDDDF